MRRKLEAITGFLILACVLALIVFALHRYAELRDQGERDVFERAPSGR